MTGYLQSIDLARLLSETPHKILQQMQTPLFLSQIGWILVTCLLAYWLSKRAQAVVSRIAANGMHKVWGWHFTRLTEYLAMPAFWFALLWAGAGVGLSFDLSLHIVGAAIDLVFAWICIRLLSSTVSSHAASIIISVAAWTVAALNILDLYRPLSAWMNSVYVYDGKHSHITLFDAASAACLLILLLWLTRLLYAFLERQISNAQSLTPSLQVLFSQLLQILLPALAIIIALQTVGVDLTTLTVAFGAIGLGVGLGLQRIVANLVAGLSLLLGKTIKPGDVLAYKETYGLVTGMGARYVTLRTLGGVEHLIPNDHFLENGVENWSYSDAKLSLSAKVGISYDSDPHQAMAICAEAIKSVSRVLSDPAPLVVLKEFGDSAITLEMYFWIEDPRSGIGSVKSDVLLAVWDRFKAAGISMPFPQRDVRVISMPETPVTAPVGAPADSAG
jgi:small-conductance mechanosensitive channel